MLPAANIGRNLANIKQTHFEDIFGSHGGGFEIEMQGIEKSINSPLSLPHENFNGMPW
jgi:hypothetical protein